MAAAATGDAATLDAEIDAVNQARKVEQVRTDGEVARLGKLGKCSWEYEFLFFLSC